MLVDLEACGTFTTEAILLPPLGVGITGHLQVIDLVNVGDSLICSSKLLLPSKNQRSSFQHSALRHVEQDVPSSGLSLSCQAPLRMHSGRLLLTLS
jgi:hypothetical protein